MPSGKLLFMHFALKKVAVTFGRRFPSVTTQVFALWVACSCQSHFGLGDGVDEGDVLAFLEVGSSSSPRTVMPSLYLRG